MEGSAEVESYIADLTAQQKGVSAAADTEHSVSVQPEDCCQVLPRHSATKRRADMTYGSALTHKVI